MVLRASDNPLPTCVISANAVGCPASATSVGTKRLAAGFDVVDERMQRLGAVGGGQVGPHAFVEAAPRLGDRPLDFRERGGGDVCDVGFVRGVLDADHVVAGHPLAGDVCPPLREDRHVGSSSDGSVRQRYPGPLKSASGRIRR